MSTKAKFVNPIMTAIALFACFVFGACVPSPSISPAYAAPPDNMGSYVVSTTKNQNGQVDTIVVIDSMNDRMMIYEASKGNLSLINVRNLRYDKRFQEYSQKGKKQTPTVKAVRKQSGG